ncbi:MAG: recombinase family protein [Actinomycetota bacterium]
MRAAGYSRVSSQRQAKEGLSLDEQEASIRSYIDAQGWELAELFTDAGVSGRKTSRPELDRLLATLPEIDRIVLVSLDRLGRDAAGLLDLFATLKAAGVELAAVRQPIDTSSAAGRLLPTLLAALAEYEAELLGERVSANAAQRASEGRHHGRAPFGYGSKAGVLVPIEAQAVIVRRIFREAGRGRSQRQITRGLNQDGIRSARGRQWRISAVGQVLRNPTYRGAIPWGDGEFKGQHVAIVKPALWQKVASERESNTETRKGGPGRLPAGPFLFTKGLLRCGLCLDAMSPRSDARDGRESYKCLGRERHGVDHCAQTPIPRKLLDAATFAYFEHVGIDVDALERQLADAVDQGRREVAAGLTDANREERQAAEAVERVRGDYTSGEISADEWRELKPGLESKHEAAQAALAQLRDREGQVEEAAAHVADPKDAALERVKSIRAAVAGKVTDAEGIEQVRLELRALFDVFLVAPRGVRAAGERTLEGLPSGVQKALAEDRAALDLEIRESGSEPFTADGWIVYPFPKPELLDGIDEAFRPILRHEGSTLPNKGGLVKSTRSVNRIASSRSPWSAP